MMQNKAAQALQNAAQEVERLEAALKESAKYFAFFLIGQGSVKVDYRTSPEFLKRVSVGDIRIIQTLTEFDGHEFALGIRDGLEFRPLTEDERQKFLIQ